MTVLDLFAGAGGWDLGARIVGIDPVVGVDNNAHACATRRAAGLLTVEADVRDIAPNDFGALEGLIASPPCQPFSQAALVEGHGSLHDALAMIDHVAAGSTPYESADARTALVAEPLHFALAMRPQWLAWEQVPPVLPVWRACADVLARNGYSTWVGYVYAEEHGVPQTRRRAVLLASRTKIVEPPTARFRRFKVGESQHDGDQSLAPWLTMGQALYFADRDWRSDVIYGRPRIADQSGTPVDLDWPMKRPSTTIPGSRGLVQHPGTTANRAAPSVTKSRNDGIRVTVEEAAMLQTFDDDYPWRGPRGAQFMQIGNAVPPRLAASLLGGLTRVARVSRDSSAGRDREAPAHRRQRISSVGAGVGEGARPQDDIAAGEGTPRDARRVFSDRAATRAGSERP